VSAQAGRGEIEDLETILDPEEWERFLGHFDDRWSREKPENIARTIRRLIILPLQAWLRTAPPHAPQFAAVQLQDAAWDLVDELEDGEPADPVLLNILAERWDDFFKKMAWGAILAAQPFKEGPRQERIDALCRVMVKALAAFRSHCGRDPSASELWESISAPCIQEKTEDTLWWVSRGKEHTTTFKAFQNRLTSIKKKLPPSKKR
jgi:hypothetical protein